MIAESKLDELFSVAVVRKKQGAVPQPEVNQSDSTSRETGTVYPDTGWGTAFHDDIGDGAITWHDADQTQTLDQDVWLVSCGLYLR